MVKPCHLSRRWGRSAALTRRTTDRALGCGSAYGCGLPHPPDALAASEQKNPAFSMREADTIVILVAYRQ